MKSQYINLLRIAQNKPPKGSSVAVNRAHKEARQVVHAALTIQADTVCGIGNSNLLDEVYSAVDNIVISPAMIAGYCEYLNELLSRGI